MGKSGLPPLIWALALLLVAASTMLIFARQERESWPSANSSRPSGVRAFSELLQRDGYRVTVESGWNPHLNDVSLAIAFFPGDIKTGNVETQDRSVIQSLEKYASKGGTVLSASLSREFDAASRSSAQPFDVTEVLTSEKFAISGAADSLLPTPLATDEHDEFEAWITYNDMPFIIALKLGDGCVVDLSDGLMLTNRFIDKRQNAAFALALIRGLVPAGGTIAFVDSSFRPPTRPSVFGAIGHWAAVARNQILLLFMLLCVMLGVRFGLAERSRRKEQGARELVDAMGDTMYRGKQTSMALKFIGANADMKIRSILKLPADAEVHIRDRALPEVLRSALQAVELAVKLGGVRQQDGLRLAKNLNQQLALWVQSVRSNHRL